MKAVKRFLLDDDISQAAKIYPPSNERAKENFRRNSRLHYQLHIIVAFLFGFLMAYFTLFFYDRYLIWSVQIEQHTTAGEYYQTGYMMALQDLELEESSIHDTLTKEVRVLCMILTCPQYHESRAVHIQRTWGRRCTKLLFISSAGDMELDAIPIVDPNEDVYDKLWNKTREAFRYAYEEHIEDYDWFLKADDDTYVIMENLRYTLYAYEPSIPIYFGYKMKRYGVEYMSGGASYVLSKEALRRFIQQSYSNETLCPTADRIGAEDVYMGVCLQNAGVLLADSKFVNENDEKTKFFPLELMAYTEPEWNLTIPDWLLNMSTQPIEMGLECCSNYSIAFHYSNPQRLYAFEFLIYQIQAFGYRPSRRERLPQKLSLEKVFEKFQRNVSFPIVDLKNVTNDF